LDEKTKEKLLCFSTNETKELFEKKSFKLSERQSAIAKYVQDIEIIELLGHREHIVFISKLCYTSNDCVQNMQVESFAQKNKCCKIYMALNNTIF